MIRLVGTSHISPEAIKRIEEEIDHGADCVAVELDMGRYEALKSGRKGSYPSIFFRLLSWIQGKLAEKTGVLPGEEMLTATDRAMENQIRVYFIDRPIYETLEDFQKLGILEKAKIALMCFTGIRGYDFNLREVPSEDIVKKSTELLSKRAPELYRVLVEKRDEIMSSALYELSEENEDVLAVVGAGHLPGIKDRLSEMGVEYVDKTFK